jgi:hypothetical protein
LNDVIALKLWLQDGSDCWMKLLLMCCLKLVYGQYVIGKYNLVSFCWFVCFFPMWLIAIFLDMLYWYWFGSDGMLYWDIILLYAWLIMWRGYLLLLKRSFMCFVSITNDACVLQMMNDLKKIDDGKLFFMCFGCEDL